MLLTVGSLHITHLDFVLNSGLTHIVICMADINLNAGNQQNIHLIPINRWIQSYCEYVHLPGLSHKEQCSSWELVVCWRQFDWVLRGTPHVGPITSFSSITGCSCAVDKFAEMTWNRCVSMSCKAAFRWDVHVYVHTCILHACMYMNLHVYT